MEIVSELTGVEEALQTLRNVAKDAQKATGRALRAISLLAQREAKRNAPRSPNRSTLNRLRKTRRPTRRSARATSRPNPGGLIRSIEAEVRGEDAAIFVAANSEAGKYAFRIHELKNKPRGWRRRGPGTVLRGSRADEKFLERAIADNDGNFVRIIKAEHRKGGWYEL